MILNTLVNREFKHLFIGRFYGINLQKISADLVSSGEEISEFTEPYEQNQLISRVAIPLLRNAPQCASQLITFWSGFDFENLKYEYLIPEILHEGVGASDFPWDHFSKPFTRDDQKASGWIVWDFDIQEMVERVIEHSSTFGPSQFMDLIKFPIPKLRRAICHKALETPQLFLTFTPEQFDNLSKNVETWPEKDRDEILCLIAAADNRCEPADALTLAEKAQSVRSMCQTVELLMKRVPQLAYDKIEDICSSIDQDEGYEFLEIVFDRNVHPLFSDTALEQILDSLIPNLQLSR